MLIITALRDRFAISSETGSNYVLISWVISDPILEQELQSIQVVVISTIDSTQTQTFNVPANQHQSVNATGLGIIILYMYY